MVNIFKLGTQELKALVQYKSVLEEEKPFPKNFWSDEKSIFKGLKPKSRILTRYCLENIHGIEPETLSQLTLSQIKAKLTESGLLGMIQRVFYHDVLSILKNAYPEHFKSKKLKDWMWSKHGIWHDDDAIIEAVQEMVRNEGIRRLEDIPSFDWKKRLLKHGIYNILAYFNWSIFAMFNFVYPNKFHPADFKYKLKWKASESLDNAFYFMHKTFKQKRYSINQIVLLTTSDFRHLGLAGMLIILFNSSTLLAKEYYLYKTQGNKEHQAELIDEIKSLLKKRADDEAIARLKKVSKGKFIYNLHSDTALYSFIKRRAGKNSMSVGDYLGHLGFVYKNAKKDAPEISTQEIWELRKQGFTYVQIAQKLGSNPTTITEICKRNFGGDPLIPRPIEDYVTVQELMDTYRVDHKTIMKLVRDNGLETHMTIRFRYVKKSELIPLLEEYSSNSRHHIFMTRRYSTANTFNV